VASRNWWTHVRPPGAQPPAAGTHIASAGTQEAAKLLHIWPGERAPRDGLANSDPLLDRVLRTAKIGESTRVTASSRRSIVRRDPDPEHPQPYNLPSQHPRFPLEMQGNPCGRMVQAKPIRPSAYVPSCISEQECRGIGRVRMPHQSACRTRRRAARPTRREWLDGRACLTSGRSSRAPRGCSPPRAAPRRRRCRRPGCGSPGR
jgi:hypothetical protein